MSKHTCGVDTHPDECLCDVIITTPTPIRVPDAVDEMWMGAQVCEIRNYGRPWSTDSMLNYFADLCLFYDRWSALQEQPTAHKGNVAHQRMVELLKEGVDNRTIRTIIKDEYGVEYSKSAVSHTKRRIGLSTSAKMAEEIGGLL